jgi:hypothetical protein
MSILARHLLLTASKAHPPPSRSRPHDVDGIFPGTPRCCILSLPLPADGGNTSAQNLESLPRFSNDRMREPAYARVSLRGRSPSLAWKTGRGKTAPPHSLSLSLFTNARQKSNVAETCPSCYEELQTGRGDGPSPLWTRVAHDEPTSMNEREKGNRTESIRRAYSASLGGPAMSTPSKRHPRSRESKERSRKSGCCVLSFRSSNSATIPFLLFHPSFLPFIFLSFFLSFFLVFTSSPLQPIYS